VQVEGVVADLTPENIASLLTGFPLLLDGTDNFETRLLVNDYAVAHGVPWIYAAVVAGYGVTMTIRPGQTACLACLMEGGAPSVTTTGEVVLTANGTPGAEQTCDTVGVLGAAAGVIASLEAAAATKLLLGKPASGGGTTHFLRRMGGPLPIDTRRAAR